MIDEIKRENMQKHWKAYKKIMDSDDDPYIHFSVGYITGWNKAISLSKKPRKAVRKSICEKPKGVCIGCKKFDGCVPSMRHPSTCDYREGVR